MALEYVTDDSGETMRMLRIHKNRFISSVFNANTIENMAHIPLRDDDIFLCSYPRTGSHWLFENIRCLITGKICKDNVHKEATMVEAFPLGHFENFPSPRILNTHVFFDDFPSDLLKGKAKVILIYRNPKDVAVSWYHLHSKIPSYEYNSPFSNFIQRFVQGNVVNNCYFDYLKMWDEAFVTNPQISYLLVRYEDLHKDPIGERRKLASFLGKEYDDAFLQDLTEATSLDVMKTEKKVPFAVKGVDVNSIVYRTGQVGDWKNKFTVSENEWFDGVVEKEMRHSKLFKFIYSID